jgi:hypothetical protein
MTIQDLTIRCVLPRVTSRIWNYVHWNNPASDDGCGAKYYACHALKCKVGGLVILQHNKIDEELCDLASKALAPSAVRVEPMIHSKCTAEETKAKDPKPPVQRLSGSTNKEWGDLLILGFWARGTDAIVDVCVTDTDAKSYRSRDPPHSRGPPSHAGAREEEEVFAVLSQTAQALHSVCRLH